MPQGVNISFNVQGFNTALGIVAAPVAVLSVTKVQSFTASATPVLVNVILNPTVLIPAPPASLAPAIATTTNFAATSQITPNDPNFGDTHTYAVTTPAVSGTAIVDAAGLTTYTPNAGFAGTDSFVVTVTDQSGLTGLVMISVTVNAQAGQTLTATVKDVLTMQPVAGLVVTLGALTATTNAAGVINFSVSPGPVTVTTSHASYIARSYPYLLRSTSTALRVFVYPVSTGATDGDGDGLPDAVESNTGVFLSALSTGSNPALADTDADGIDDGREVLR